MNNLAAAFAGGKAFIAFIICGDPDLETSAACVRAAAENGADIIELGIPFSDPTSEGPEVQSANVRALRGGVTVDKIFAMLKNLRAEVAAPFVLRAYANVVFSYGIERFAAACAEAGVSGLVLTDVPFEEKEEFAAPCRACGVSLISVVTPASRGRIGRIAREAEGFLYAAAGRGEEGGLSSVIEEAKQVCPVPCVVWADIAAPAGAKALCGAEDGIAADTQIVRIAAKYGKQAPAHIGAFVKEIKAALR